MAILTLALGIGANTAIFTLVHAVMLKSLPVADPQRLYRLGRGDDCCVNSGYSSNFSLYAHPLYEYLRDHTPELEELAAFSASTMPLNVVRGSAEPQTFDGELVSGNYFTTFGVRPFAGRLLTASDDVPGAPPAAILSYRAWEQNYALDPAIIGSTFILNGLAYTVAGIAPPGFFGDTLRANPPDFWLPLGTEPALRGKNTLLRERDQRWLYAVGRIRSGASPGVIEAKVNVEMKQWFLEEHGGKVDQRRVSQQHIQVTPAGAGVTTLRNGYRDALQILMLVSGFVLLIACANVANLLLTRGTAGRVQASIRLALGASRNRLMRQSLTESIVLALAGGIAGVAVAFAGARLLLRLAFSGARWVPIDPNPSLPVLAFALLLAIATGLIFGAAPAWSAARLDPVEALRGAGRSAGNRATLPQKSLVVLQAALSLVLIAGAGVLTGSLRNLENQSFGFATDGRVVAQVSLAAGSYRPDRLFQVYRQLEEDLPRIPGVRGAAFSLYEPMSGGGWSSGIFFEDHPLPPGPDTPYFSLWVRISHHYFETIGVRLLEGRPFDDRDTPAAPRVAIVTQAFARKFLPGESAIGKHFGMNQRPHDYEIVGVAQDHKYVNAREDAGPVFFLPFLQMSAADWKSNVSARSNYLHAIELRTAPNARELEPDLRRTLAQIDSNLTVWRVRSFREQVDGNFNQERLIARLTGLFALLALVLASVGLYGITAYSVARRTAEIGIRTALGASRASVTAMILRDALAQIACGLAIGVPAALASGRLVEHQLYGIRSSDPTVLAGAALLLIACATMAGLVPARRATAIDPASALRSE